MDEHELPEVLNAMRNRPRFKLHTELSQVEYEERLKQFLKENPSYKGLMSRHGAVIKVNTKEDPFWKPRLMLNTEPDEEGQGTTIRGMYGPSQAVWAFFLFFYVVFSLLAMLFFTWWEIQRQLDSNDNPWALTISIIFIVLLGLTYLASWIGKIKSLTEIKMLRDFAERSTLPIKSEKKVA